MDMFLAFEEPSVGFHLQTEMEVERLGFGGCDFIVFAVDGELRIVGVLDPTSGVTAVEFVVDIGFVPLFVEILDIPVFAGEIHHRAGSVVLGLHIKPRHTGCVGYFLVVRTESGCDMYDTGTVFCGDIIAGNDDIGFQLSVFSIQIPAVNGVDPWEEGFVLQADKVCAFAAPDDFRGLRFAVGSCLRFAVGRLRAQFFQISAQARLGEDNMIACRGLHFYVVDLRANAEGGVRRQSPRRSGPGDEISGCAV